MGVIEEIRSTAGDAFMTLPLLFIGLTFFLGTLTSNIALLYLFLGHLLLVPALSFVANEPGPAWFEGNSSISILKAVKWVFSTFLLLGIHGNALGGGNAYNIYWLALLPFLGQFLLHSRGKDVPVLWFLNPVAWFSESPKPPVNTCPLLPGGDTTSFTPSLWITHLTFFLGFLASNAVQIYSQEAPKLTSVAGDEATRQDRENRLALRVRNRKMLAASILASIVIVFCVLLFFRYTKTSCESGFFYSLIPVILIGLTGSAWFHVLYTSCGIRPADVLGIVQGMISPDLIDRPIVCMGS